MFDGTSVFRYGCEDMRATGNDWGSRWTTTAKKVSLEELPDDLKHDGELLPAGAWSLRQLRSHREVYFDAYPEKARELPESIWEIDFGAVAKRMRLALSDWPDVPKAARRPSADSIPEAWKACAELAKGRAAGDALAALSEFEEYFSSEEAAEQKLKRLREEAPPGVEELQERVSIARANFSMKRHAIVRFRRKFAMTFEVPNLSKQDIAEVTGYRTPAHAREARQILNDHPSISEFAQLAGKMPGPAGRGNSKVDTLKRAIGYNELPREEKTFARFKELLFDAEIT
jgi:hypothetical protein